MTMVQKTGDEDMREDTEYDLFSHWIDLPMSWHCYITQLELDTDLVSRKITTSSN
jgi:hypothetical protein